MASVSDIQQMLSAQTEKLSKLLEERVAGICATVAIQGQSVKEMSDRIDKLQGAHEATIARMDALETAHQVAISKSPLSHAVQSGKRRALDGGFVGDGSSTSMGGGGSSSVASLEDAHRLLILGFQDRLMASTLERVAHDIVSKCATTEAGRLIRVRAYDLQKKVTLDFPSPAMASDFSDNFRKLSESYNMPNPRNPSELWPLRVRRNLSPQHRLLFFKMGKVRAAVQEELSKRGLQANSNGIGGDVFGLRSKEDPVPLFHLYCCPQKADVIHIKVDDEGLKALGLDSPPLRQKFQDAFETAPTRPF